ncbi:MAG: S8 family serine peptidase [Firmicutes bacterium]|nr:S8 family serine peptidase [Bacillota bacterium]
MYSKVFLKKIASIALAIIIATTTPTGVAFAMETGGASEETGAAVQTVTEENTDQEQIPGAEQTEEPAENPAESLSENPVDEQVTEPVEVPEEELVEEPAEEPEFDPAKIYGEYAEGEIIVTYDDAGLSDQKAEEVDQEAEAAIAEVGGEVEKQLVGQSGKEDTVVLATLDGGTTVAEAISQLDAEESIAEVQPNYIYRLQDQYTTNSTSGQYYLYRTGTINSWSRYGSGSNVTVAVLDTGCRLNHPDLTGNLLTNLAWDAANDEPLAGDIQGHGTHVCGIIGATNGNGIGISGVSNNAKILPVNVFTKYANGGVGAYSSDIVTAYEYLDDLIEGGNTSIKVVNMSLGSLYASGYNYVPYKRGQSTPVYGDKKVEKSIYDLRKDHNVLTVCAGGNSGANNRFNFPSDFESCIAVMALDENNNKASFSDYNQYKDVSAPGKYILSTTWNGSYGYMSGTSQASPIVAGIAALIYSNAASRGVNITADKVVSTLLDSTVPVSGCAPMVHAEYASYSAVGQTHINTCNVGLSGTWFQYTGGGIYPAVTVRTKDGRTLQNGVDYTLGYSNNVGIGTARVTIYGRGNIVGSKAATYTINPSGTKLKSVKAAKKAVTPKWTKNKSINGYQIAVSQSPNFSGSKYVTVSKNKTVSKKVSKLAKKKTYYVRVRTYKTVGGVKYYSAWSNVKTKKTK